MRRTINIVILSWLLFFIGCTNVKVSQDFDPKVDLSGYHTWRWKFSEQPRTGDIRIDNQLLDHRIRKAVENHLTGRSIYPVGKMFDFIVSYHLVINKKIYGDSYPSTFGWGGYYYPWGWDIGTETRVYQVDQSSLTIDVHSVDTHDLLWRGVGVYLLTTYKTPQDAADAMQKTVDKILQQFPPHQ